MLCEKALFYYNNGFNCSQCLIKAYSDVYNIKIDPQLLGVTAVINNGFGVGNMCSAIVTAIIILSIHYDTESAKTKQLLFLDRFHKKFKDFHCLKIRNAGCEKILTEICEILDDFFLWNSVT